MIERKQVDSFKVQHVNTGTIHDVAVYERRIEGYPVLDFETNGGSCLRRISKNQFEMPATKARFTRA